MTISTIKAVVSWELRYFFQTCFSALIQPLKKTEKEFFVGFFVYFKIWREHCDTCYFEHSQTKISVPRWWGNPVWKLKYVNPDLVFYPLTICRAPFMRKDFKPASVVLAVLLPVNYRSNLLNGFLNLPINFYAVWKKCRWHLFLLFKAAVAISRLVTKFQQLLWRSIEWNFLYSGKVRQSKFW